MRAPSQARYDLASYALVAVALVLAVKLQLLPALLAGLLVYELVHVIARRLPLARLGSTRTKMVAVGLLAVIIIALVTLIISGIVAFFRSDAGDLSALLQKMADIIEGSRGLLPRWLLPYLPENPEALRAAIGDWLRTHAADLQHVGREAGHFTMRLVIGMVTGGMIALHEARPELEMGPLGSALIERAKRLAEAFRRIVFAQIRISAVNAVLTGLYLVAALPLLGIHLPFAKTMVVITFLTGLIPVVGNLISNAVIIVVSLNHSLATAIGSLAFLVVIHRLEYFINARIVGDQINARPWELLLALLVMEAAFGAAGVLAAPIYYAYLKDELQARGLI